MLLESILYMALSITELFKYNTNGNHLIMTDMKLFRSVKSLTSFAYIQDHAQVGLVHQHLRRFYPAGVLVQSTAENAYQAAQAPGSRGWLV